MHLATELIEGLEEFVVGQDLGPRAHRIAEFERMHDPDDGIVAELDDVVIDVGERAIFGDAEHAEQFVLGAVAAQTIRWTRPNATG